MSRIESDLCMKDRLVPQGELFFEMGIDKLWSYEEAAKFLSVSVRTLKRKVKSRKIPCIKIGKRVLFVPWVLKERVEKGGSL